MASLVRSVESGVVDKSATVVLNITGGGERLYKMGKNLCSLEPSAVFRVEALAEEVVAKVEELFGFAASTDK